MPLRAAPHLLALLLALCLARFAPTVSAQGTLGCALTASDWSRVAASLTKHYFHPDFASTDCSLSANASAASLLKRYAGCAASLRDVVSSLGQACDATLAPVLYVGGAQTATANAARADSLCSLSLNDFVADVLCDPSATVNCPRPIQIHYFASFIACFLRVPNMTVAELATFWDTGQDKVCMDSINFCGSGTNSRLFLEWSTCPVPVGDVFSYMDVRGIWSCATYFEGRLERCSSPYAHLYSNV